MTTRTQVFHEYLRKTVFASSYGTKVEFFLIKRCRKSRDTVPLRKPNDGLKDDNRNLVKKLFCTYFGPFFFTGSTITKEIGIY